MILDINLISHPGCKNLNTFTLDALRSRRNFFFPVVFIIGTSILTHKILLFMFLENIKLPRAGSKRPTLPVIPTGLTKSAASLPGTPKFKTPKKPLAASNANLK